MISGIQAQVSRLIEAYCESRQWQRKSEDRIGRLEQALQQQPAIPGGGGGGGGAWYVRAVDAVVIAAGSSGTADVYRLVSGTPTLTVPGATLYNVTGGATVTGKVIFLQRNDDGSFLVNGQACA